MFTFILHNAYYQIYIQTLQPSRPKTKKISQNNKSFTKYKKTSKILFEKLKIQKNLLTKQSLHNSSLKIHKFFIIFSSLTCKFFLILCL